MGGITPRTNAKKTMYIRYILEVGGVSPFVKPPTGKSFRFVRACERARRGEAVWASERRFDCVARAVVGAICVLRPRNHAGWVVHAKCCFYAGLIRFVADNLRKTNVKTTFAADNLIKPL